MSWQYSGVFFRAQRAEHAAAHDFGKADDGVERRAQLVAHIGEEFRLGLVGFLGAVLLVGIFLREIDQFDGLLLQRGLRALQVDHGGAQPKVVVDQLLFVLLDAGDVGADRDVAAVLGAALGDVQPAAVVELRLEGARARRLRARFPASACGPPACCRPRSRSHRTCPARPRSPAAGAVAGSASCTAPGGLRRPTARRPRGWSRWRRAAAGRLPRSSRRGSSAR